MCNVDTAKDYLGRAVKTAKNPSMNPVKQFKKTVNESLDINGQAMAAEKQQKLLDKQNKGIADVNAATLADAPAGTYITATDSFVTDKGVVKSKRQQQNSLLTAQQTSLLG